MKNTYFNTSIESFFKKIDLMHEELKNFSQDIGERREKAFALLEKFEIDCKGLSQNFAPVQLYNENRKKINSVDKILINEINRIQQTISSWHKQIEKNKKGIEFMVAHEKYLVVMVFGSVKAGKSSLGNFFAGKYFQKAPFNNEYKLRPHPKFEVEERARDTGEIEIDETGHQWFTEGVTDTTGSIQYFTLSGLRWMDSPGTGAIQKDNDKRLMEDMVNEYIPYADLCIFLMNSSEPGLQADMKYMEKLSRDGQESLVVITKSDMNDEDIDEDGNLVAKWLPKPNEQRRLQEDDICRRLKEAYGDIDPEKFRGMSVSTLLGKESILQEDEELYKSSNLDKLMNILSEKVSHEGITLKEKKPKQNLNSFVKSIKEGEEAFLGVIGLEKNLDTIIDKIGEYKKSIEKKSQKITNEITMKSKVSVQTKIRELSKQVENDGVELTGQQISEAIARVIYPIMEEELNAHLNELIVGYQKQNIKNLDLKIKGDTGLKKKQQVIEHSRVETYMVKRDPRGFFENVRWIFGKEYYSEKTRTIKESRTVDIGTNIEEIIDQYQPQVISGVRENVKKELRFLQDNYFAPQERYVMEMKRLLNMLDKELEQLKL